MPTQVPRGVQVSFLKGRWQGAGGTRLAAGQHDAPEFSHPTDAIKACIHPTAVHWSRTTTAPGAC